MAVRVYIFFSIRTQRKPLDVENILYGRQEIIIPLLVQAIVVIGIFAFLCCSVLVAKPFKFNVNQYRNVTPTNRFCTVLRCPLLSVCI